MSTRKTGQFYENVLNVLKSHAVRLNIELDPQHVMSDFEIAFLNAARNTLPNSHLHACNFHFTQSIWKHAVLKGLKGVYTTNGEVRKIVQCLMALGFIPLSDLFDVFDSIAQDVEDMDNEYQQALMELVDYVEKFYIRGTPARGRRRATEARFMPDLWNVYDLTQNQIQRTNNVVEGWHSGFQTYDKGD